MAIFYERIFSDSSEAWVASGIRLVVSMFRARVWLFNACVGKEFGKRLSAGFGICFKEVHASVVPVLVSVSGPVFGFQDFDTSSGGY